MTNTTRTEIIAVGTEILLGQIANTNAQWMSEQLAINGINTYYHTVVGDNLDRIVEALEIAANRSDVIIINGGLGPTQDDVSREAFQQLSKMSIVEESKSLEKIKAYYRKQGQQMTSNNLRQARVFADSLVLDNQVGMAPGNLVEYNGKKWIFLPGVPKEMKQIFTDEVIPYLKKMNGEMIIQSTVLRFSGIGESALEDKLEELITNQDNPTIAPLAQKDGVTIRLTAKAERKEEAQHLIQDVKERILSQVGKYYYGEDDDTVEGTVLDLLRTNNITIGAAESLTGGAFSDKLVSLEGASTAFKGAVVCYDEEVKRNVLHVTSDTLANHGTVSSTCAIELAKHTASMLNSTIGISFTGVAGPGEVERKEVGTVYIGIYDQRTGYEYVESCFFQGDRAQIRYRSVLQGYNLLLHYLKNS